MPLEKLEFLFDFSRLVALVKNSFAVLVFRCRSASWRRALAGDSGRERRVSGRERTRTRKRSLLSQFPSSLSPFSSFEKMEQSRVFFLPSLSPPLFTFRPTSRVLGDDDQREERDATRELSLSFSLCAPSLSLSQSLLRSSSRHGRPGKQQGRVCWRE